MVYTIEGMHFGDGVGLSEPVARGATLAAELMLRDITAWVRQA